MLKRERIHSNHRFMVGVSRKVIRWVLSFVDGSAVGASDGGENGNQDSMQLSPSSAREK
jgi:hypothetical protein